MSNKPKTAPNVVDAYKFLRREITLLTTDLLAGSGLGAKQASALICLSELGAVTMGELADFIQSDNAAATRIATSLAGMGLITRTASTTDRRQMVMRLTPKGLRRAPAAVAVYDELGKRIGRVLTKGDQRDLAVLMDRLSVALREGREEPAAAAKAVAAVKAPRTKAAPAARPAATKAAAKGTRARA